MGDEISKLKKDHKQNNSKIQQMKLFYTRKSIKVHRKSRAKILEEDENKNFISSDIGIAVDHILNPDRDSEGSSFDVCSESKNLYLCLQAQSGPNQKEIRRNFKNESNHQVRVSTASYNKRNHKKAFFDENRVEEK